MSAQASAVSRQGMLFGDPLEGIETDEVGYRGPIACSAAGITYRQLDTGLAPVCSSPRSVQRAVPDLNVSIVPRHPGSEDREEAPGTQAYLCSRCAWPSAPCRTGEWTTWRRSPL